MKRAIVTGATGAVGTALVRELAEAGTEVLVFVRKDSKRSQNIPDHPLVRRLSCALEDLASVRNDTGLDWDVFYHLAWAGTTGSDRNDMYLQNQNVKYALDAVAAAKRFGCRLFVGAGSQAEYGRVEGTLKPDTPAFPEMGYGYAKLCAGQMTRDYAHQLGLKHTWVRILSVYGPHDGAGSMVMSAIRKLRSGQTPEFTKAEQQWDYLYSGDAARALRLLGEAGTVEKTAENGTAGNGTAGNGTEGNGTEGNGTAGSEIAGNGIAGNVTAEDGVAEAAEGTVAAETSAGAGSAATKNAHGCDGRVYVLGSGQARPLAEYICQIRDIAAPGQPLGIGKLPYAPDQVMYLCADISALTRDTGWRPETSFEDGIRATLGSVKEEERAMRNTIVESER